MPLPDDWVPVWEHRHLAMAVRLLGYAVRVFSRQGLGDSASGQDLGSTDSGSNR